jgi:hypothetical protein
MEAQEFDFALTDLETRVDRLRALYENWFRGYEKSEPQVARKEVERKVYAMRKELPRNTALRFRYNQLYQRYTTLSNYWQRTARQIEEGTHRLQLQRLRRAKDREAPDEHTAQTAGDDEKKLERPRSFELDEADSVDIDSIFAEVMRDDSRPAPAAQAAVPQASLPALSLAPVEVTVQTARPEPAPEGVSPARPRVVGTFSRPRLDSDKASDPAKSSAVPNTTPPAVPDKRASAAQLPLPPPRVGTAPTLPAPPFKVSLPATGADKSLVPAAPSAQQPRPPAVAPRPPAPPPATRASLGLSANPAEVAARVSGASPQPAAVRPPPPPVPARPAAPAHAASVPATPAPTFSDQRMRRLYEEYSSARKRNNEADVRFEAVAQSIKKMLPDLEKKHAGKRIEFEVVLKDGRVGLKPKAV